VLKQFASIAPLLRVPALLGAASILMASGCSKTPGDGTPASAAAATTKGNRPDAAPAGEKGAAEGSGGRRAASIILAASDVKTVIIPFTNINAAFGGKTIDAAFQIEPFTTAAVENQFAVRFKGLDEITPYDSAGFLVMSEAFAARTEVAQAWMVAYLRGVRDYMDAVDKGRGKEEIIKILMDNTRIKDRAIYDKMVMPAFHPNGEIDPESIRRAYREYRKLGYVTVELDPDKVYDPSFIRYATKLLGAYPHRYPY